MKPLVIFHGSGSKDSGFGGCTDGFGAAFAAWLRFGDEAEYFPMQYGQEVGLDNPSGANTNAVFWSGREVYVLDFSFSKPQMDTLFQIAKRVVWLDHHKTAFEMFAYDGKLFGQISAVSGQKANDVVMLDNNKSGALLAWEYFHPGTEVPMLIQHIDDRDRWQFKLDGSKELLASQ